MKIRPLQFFGERALRWRRGTGGASLVEFALVLPLLLVLYLGGFEVSQLVTTYRKMCDATAQLGNIASQTTPPTTMADLQNQMAAATQVMSPSSTSNLTLVLTEITTDTKSKATVTWSQAWNGGTAHTSGAAWTLPAALVTPSTSYLLVESSYAYKATFGSAYTGVNIPLSDQLYMPPRNNSSISCSDCPPPP